MHGTKDENPGLGTFKMAFRVGRRVRTVKPGVAAVLGLLLFAAGCKPPLLNAIDVVYIPDRPSVFIGQVERISVLSLRDGAEDQAIEFAVDEETIARGVSDGEGQVRVATTLKQLPETPFVDVTTHIDGRWLHVRRPIHMWEAGKVIIAVDVDHTLSDTNWKDLLFHPFDRKSTPMPGSLEVMQSLTQDYHILYLTARPPFLLEETRRWLADNGYPNGPVLTSPTGGMVLKPKESKQEYLSWLRESWPHLLIGIGDKASDVRAYENSGMVGIVLADADFDVDTINTIKVGSWEEIGELLDGHSEDMRDAKRLADLIQRGAKPHLTGIQPARTASPAEGGDAKTE